MMNGQTIDSACRTGRVSKINYEEGTYEVTYFDRGKSVTRKINAMSNNEYMMPKIGQIVSVSHNGNGTAAACTTGTVWNKSNPPAEGYEGLFRKDFSNDKGQCYARYDANTGDFWLIVDKRLFIEVDKTTVIEMTKDYIKIHRTPEVSIEMDDDIRIHRKVTTIDLTENIDEETPEGKIFLNNCKD